MNFKIKPREPSIGGSSYCRRCENFHPPGPCTKTTTVKQDLSKQRDKIKKLESELEKALATFEAIYLKARFVSKEFRNEHIRIIENMAGIRMEELKEVLEGE